jgi:NAD(P)-dependent dehydrogenase (short-subunit alcohol dehydrogenase family)
VSHPLNNWTAADIPSQAGKFAIVTGANSGTGYHTALELARAGAEVVIACRNEAKGLTAVASIKAAIPAANISLELLDLASLESVAAFAKIIKSTYGALDLLINNAGIMAIPRQTTVDGNEMQLATNYLGHFALTAHLLPLLRQAKKPRTVQLSSIAHKRAALRLGDLQSRHRYLAYKVYGQSKLAMLMFALELQRRSDANGWNITSLAAHPGVARTELIPNGPGAASLTAFGAKLISPFLFQSAAAGALPILYAATSPNVTPGGYYGSIGFQEMKGPPGPAIIMPQAQNLEDAKELWEISERITGTHFGQEQSA